MKNKKINTEIKKLALTTAVAMFVFLTNATGSLHAQQYSPGYGTNQTPITEVQPPSQCVVEMDAYIKVQEGLFRDFLTTNYQNKSSTTSLLDLGLGRYKEYRTNLYKKYNSYFPKHGALQFSEGIISSTCLDMVNQALSRARNQLKTSSIQTSTVKKATALIHKYQDINEQLATLNRTFLKMKAYLDTFASKLPCYIKKACNKG